MVALILLLTLAGVLADPASETDDASLPPGIISDAQREAKMADIMTHVFDPMDENMDGQLSREEFLAFVHHGAPSDLVVDDELVWEKHMVS
jgi:hypothetical protein